MTDQTATELDLRAVLDAVPRAGATLPEIADKLGISTSSLFLRFVLDRLLIGDLVSVRWPLGGSTEWASTARAIRMADAGAPELTAWIRSRLSSASSLPGGGTR